MATVDELSIQVAAQTQTAALAIDALTAALERLNTILGPTLTQLRGVGAAMTGITSAASARAASVAKGTTAAIAPVGVPTPAVVPTAAGTAVATQMKGVTTEANKATAAVQKTAGAASAVGKSSKQVGLLTGSFIKLRSTLFFTLFILGGLVLAFKNTLGQASQMTEVANQVGVAFGDMSDEAVRWAETMSGGVLDVAPILKSASVFNDMARAMGIVNDQALTMSKNLTQLSYDYASLKDVPFAESQQKFQSALAGQTKGVRAYGLDITQASLQEEIYREGLNYKIKDLNRASKAVIIHNALVRQSSRAHGDLARTIATPANMMRVLADTLRMAGRAIGYLFMPMLKAVLPWLIGFAQLVLGAAQALGRVFGIKVPSWSGLIKEMGSAKAGTASMADNMGKTEKAAKGAAKAAKAMKDYTLGIDELNILSPQTDTSSGGGGGAGGGAGMGGGVAPGIKPMDVYDFGDIAGQIEKKLAPIKAFFKGIAKAAEPFIETWKENFQNLWEVLEPIFKRIGALLKIFWENWVKPILKVLAAVWNQTWDVIIGVIKLVWVIIEPIVDAMIKQFKKFSEKFIKPFLEWIAKKISSKDMTKFFDDLIAKVKEAQEWVADKVAIIKEDIEAFGQAWQDLTFETKQAVAEFVKKNWEKTKEAWDTAKKWVSSAVSKTIEGVKKGWDAIVSAWDTAKTWVSNTVVKTLNAVITNAFEKAKDAWDWFKDKSVSLGISIREGAMAAISRLIHGYNRLALAAAVATKKQLPVFRAPDGNYGIPLRMGAYVNYMAQGGSAQRGQMFVAGEKGPELVGSFGGNPNTVMPLANSGFVEAMAGAVYTATARAMAEMGVGGNGDVFMDGERVGEIVRKGERRSGVGLSIVGTVGQ